MNYPSKTVSIKYDSDKQMLYGDVDGVSTPFQGYMLVPDYSRSEPVAVYNKGQNYELGELIHKHLDHPYCAWHGSVPIGVLPPVNPAMSYTCPAHGFIKISAYLQTASEGTVALNAYLYRDSSYTNIYASMNSNLTQGTAAPTALVPVREGDIIYWGSSKIWPDGINFVGPHVYAIHFIYALKEKT